MGETGVSGRTLWLFHPCTVSPYHRLNHTMGSTLFRYIFKDLLRVFLLASLVIAGIMSFAGLLRPLSERGLDGSQVLRMLAWLLPAMATYSLPVAALFATTFVYGRLAADNETTAIRAAGVPTGLTGLTLPGLVLGAGAFAASLGLLCFIVPAANLQVERVVYSNLARLSANEINRTKRLSFKGGGAGRLTLTADGAEVLDVASLPAGSGVTPDTQVVQLQNVYVLRYQNVGREGDRYDVPVEIFTAQRATAFIEPPAHVGEGKLLGTALRDERFMLTVLLENGLKFPRVFEGRDDAPLVAAITASQVGPIALGSPVRENTKFLDILELRDLYREPQRGRQVGELVTSLAEHEQRQTFLTRLRTEAAEGGTTLDAAEGRFVLTTHAATGLLGDDRLHLTVGSDGFIELVQQRPGETVTVSAPRATLTAEPVRLPEGLRMLVVMTFEDAAVTIDPAEGEPETTEGRTFERRALVEMPQEISAIAEKDAEEFLAETTVEGGRADYVRGRMLRQQNAVEAEIWARLSFATSCLILPVAGAALGMMFRSGNFLTAFAASVVPALLSIVLVVVGQHLAENVPQKLADGRWSNPLSGALPLIWGGNAIVGAAIVVLLMRLRRS